MSVCLPLMKNVLTPLAKSILIPLGVTTVASTTYDPFYRKIFESGMIVWMNFKRRDEWYHENS